MDLKNYINILWRRKWVILLTLLLTFGVVYLGTMMTEPVYRAAAVLRIAVSSGGSLSSQDYIYADQLMNTYVEMATRKPVLDELSKRLDLTRPLGIRVEIIPNTELIEITVQDTDPGLAAMAANTLAEVLIAHGNNLYLGGDKRLSDVLGEQLTQIQADLDATRQEYELLLHRTPVPKEIDATMQLLQLKQSNYATLLTQYQQARFKEEIQRGMITVFENATIPQQPSSPRVKINLALALVFGLAGGLGLAALFENIDPTIYTTEQIESLTGLTAVAKIPKAKKKHLLLREESFSPMGEAFWTLATYLQQSEQWHGVKVILILGAEPNQGKSLVVSQLARALAEGGRKVIAVDCDMRLPQLHSLFGLSNQIGLSVLLERKLNWETALQKSSYESLSILTSGPPPSHTSKLLASPQMSELIKSLSRRADFVLLDTPALLGIADVAALVQKVHGSLWVVRRTYATRAALEAARNFLTRFSGKPVGLVVNQAEDDVNHGYYKAQFSASSGRSLTEIAPGPNVVSEPPSVPQ